MYNYNIDLDLLTYIDYCGNKRQAYEVDLDEFCSITHAYMGVKRCGRYEYVFYYHGMSSFNIDTGEIKYFIRIISDDERRRFLDEIGDV